MRIIVLVLAFHALAANAQSAAILGPHAEDCAAGASGTSVLVTVTGFKDRAGNLRVELYPANDADFLAPGSRLRAEGKLFDRIDLPMPLSGDAAVCVALPATGEYAISVLHDRNANGKLNPFSDGYGFPNNPRLGLSKPKVALATFKANEGGNSLRIVLNYWTGFAARPLRDPS